MSSSASERTPTARRPKVLQLVTLAEVGGAQTCVQWLLPAAAAHFDVVVAAYGPGPLVEATARAGATFVPLRHVRRPIHPLRDLLGLVELILLMRRERPAIVHTHSSKAGILGRLAARVARVPVVLFTAHGWAFKAERGRRATLYRFADGALARVTTRIICVSETEARAGLAAGTCLPENTIVIRNPAPPANRVSRPKRSASPIIVSVGRLKAPKDFPTLVAALGRISSRDFVARIVGDGPDRDALIRAVSAAGVADKVEFLGERADVADLMAQSDVFALSSRSEGLPIAVLEAMACGLPVVASDVGGVSEAVVQSETGLLVPAGDPDAFAAALVTLLDDADLRTRLGDGGRRRCEAEFRVEEWQEKHIRLYRELLAP